jgi:hypothetical protein
MKLHHGGDRLPWTGAHAQNNFEPLRSLDWQAHVYGEVDKDVETVCRQFRLPLHGFAWNNGTADAGLKRDALYLVRPDGYIALASFEQSVSRLKTFVEQFNLRFQSASVRR